MVVVTNTIGAARVYSTLAVLALAEHTGFGGVASLGVIRTNSEPLIGINIGVVTNAEGEVPLYRGARTD